LGNTIFDSQSAFGCTTLDTVVNQNANPDGCEWPRVVTSINTEQINSDGTYDALMMVDTSDSYTIIVNGSNWFPLTLGSTQYYPLTVDQLLNIEIIDEDGCSNFTQLLPQFGIVLTQRPVGCDSIALVSEISGAIGNVFYQWSTGSTDPVITISHSVDSVWLIISDSVSMRSDTVWYYPYYHYEESLTSLIVHDGSISHCFDNGSISVEFLGTQNAYHLITSFGIDQIVERNTTYNSLDFYEDSFYASNIPYGEHWIQLSDTFGCITLVDTFQIKLYQDSWAVTLVGNNLCDSIKTISLNHPYHQDSVQYLLWNTGSINVDSINVTQAGTYSATLMLNNGCAHVDSFNVAEPLSISNIVLDRSGFCLNGGNTTRGSIGCTIAGGYSFGSSLVARAQVIDTNGIAYVNGAGYSDSTFSRYWLRPGPYTIQIEDASGCTLDSLVYLDNPNIDSVTYEVIPPTCSGGSDGQIIVTPYGGGLPYLYDCDDVPGNQTDSIATALAANANGYYWQRPDVTVTNTLGCEVEIENIIITDRPILSLVVDSIEDATCESAHNGQAALTITGGVQLYSFMWSDSSTSQDRLDLGIGTHTVTVTDSVGCITIGTVAIGTLYPDSNFVFVGMDSIGFTTNDTIGITDHLVEITNSPIWLITDSTYYEIDQVFTHHWEAIDSVVNKYECGTLEDTLVYRIDTILVSSPFIFDTIVELLYSDTLCLGTTAGWSSNYVFTERDTIVLPIVTVVKDTADHWFLSDSLVEQVTTECGHLNQANLAGDSIFSCGMFQYLDTFLVDTNYVNTICVSDTIEIAHVLDTICRYTDSIYVVILPYQELVDSGTVVETIVDSVLHEYFIVYDTTVNYTHISSIEDWEHVDSMNYRSLCGVLDTSWLISNDYLLSEYNIIDSIWSNMWSDTIYRDTTTTGVNDIGFVKTTIYPNPTQDILNISFEKSGTYSVVLYDTGGKLLRQKQVDGTTVIFEMYDLADGVYLVHMSDGENAKVTKILKN